MASPHFVQRHVPLAPLTALQVGGPANFFAPFTKASEVQAVLLWARTERIPVACFGGGRNVIVADAGYPGVVLHPIGWRMHLEESAITTEAGVQVSDLLNFALTHGFGGAEWLVEIPGQVGGAVVSNISRGHSSLDAYIDWVETVMPDGRLKRWATAECQFSPGQSVFQTNQAVIVRINWKFQPADKQSEQARLAAASARHRAAQPTGAAAIMFREAAPRRPLPERLKALINDDGLIPAAALVQEIDLAGHRLGKMMISAEHPNWLINTGGGTADQAVQLLSLVKQKVRDTLGIQLYESIKLFGF